MKFSGLVSFELTSDELVELSKAIISGWLASIGQILTNNQVRLVGIDVARTAGEIASYKMPYLRASLNFPALKF